jgi:hypothetical protein
MSKWVLVPVEPTSEMKTAGIGFDVYEGTGVIDCLTWEEVTAIYKAMLAAAPAPEVQPVAWRIKGVKEWICSPIPVEGGEFQSTMWEPLYLNPPAADVAELVEALRLLLDQDEHGEDEIWVRKKARAALKKWDEK